MKIKETTPRKERTFKLKITERELQVIQAWAAASSREYRLYEILSNGPVP